MAEQDNQANAKENQTQQGLTSSRRKFLIKGASAAPLVTLAASRPVWGTGGSTCVLSGTMSGNLSSNNGVDVCTSAVGQPPSYWASWSQSFSKTKTVRQAGKRVLNNWNKASCWPTTSFASVFGYNACNGETTFADVLAGGVCKTADDFDQQAAAAYMSACHQKMAYTVPYTPAQVKSAYRKARQYWGTQASLDIIELFSALFHNTQPGALYTGQYKWDKQEKTLLETEFHVLRKAVRDGLSTY